MAKHSVVVLVGDGVTDTFAVNFTGGYIDDSHVTVQVNNEVDGAGAPLYRTITFISEGVAQVGGEVPGVGAPVEFRRTTPISEPIHDYSGGAVFSAAAVDNSFDQVLKGVQEAQDQLEGIGEVEAFADAAEASAQQAALSADVAVEAARALGNSVSGYGAVGDGVTDDYAAIQQAIDETLPVIGDHKVVWLPPGKYAHSVCWELPDNCTLVLDNCETFLMDDSFDNCFRPKQFRAMRKDAGGTDTRDDGIREAVVAYTDNDGSTVEGTTVVIGDFTYEALSPTHENYGDVPTDMRATRADNFRFRPAKAQNIHLVGYGTATINGNGLFNFAHGGAWATYRQVGVNWAFVDNFSMKNLTVRNIARWGISMEHCSNGVFEDITMDQPGWSGRSDDPRDYAAGDYGFRAEPGLPNQDGINLRKGVTDVSIRGLFGQTGDDCIAITNLYATDDSSSERDNHASSNWAPYGAATLRVSIDHVRCIPNGGHHVIRLLSSDENLIRFVSITDVVDMTTAADVVGNEQNTVGGSTSYHAAEACILIGDNAYGDTLSTAVSIRDITIRDITTTARYGVLNKGASSRVTVDGLVLTGDITLGQDSVDLMRSNVGFRDGAAHPTETIVQANLTSEDHEYNGLVKRHSYGTRGAGYLVDVLSGAAVLRTRFVSSDVWACQSVIRMASANTLVSAVDFDGLHTYLMRGPFMDVGSATPNYAGSSGTLSRFSSVGRRFNQDDIDGGGVDRFYTDNFFWKMDGSTPEVIGVDVEPIPTYRSVVDFEANKLASNYGSGALYALDLQALADGTAWVPERSYGISGTSASGYRIGSGGIMEAWVRYADFDLSSSSAQYFASPVLFSRARVNVCPVGAVGVADRAGWHSAFGSYNAGGTAGEEIMLACDGSGADSTENAEIFIHGNI